MVSWLIWSAEHKNRGFSLWHFKILLKDASGVFEILSAPLRTRHMPCFKREVSRIPRGSFQILAVVQHAQVVAGYKPTETRHILKLPSLFLSAGGVISYIGSNGSSPSRTSPVSLCGSDSSNSSCQLSSQAPFPSYFPPSPTGSLVQDAGRPYGSSSAGLREDASPSSSSSSSSYSSGGSPVGLQVAMDDGKRGSPTKSISSGITSE